MLSNAIELLKSVACIIQSRLTRFNASSWTKIVRTGALSRECHKLLSILLLGHILKAINSNELVLVLFTDWFMDQIRSQPVRDTYLSWFEPVPGAMTAARPRFRFRLKVLRWSLTSLIIWNLSLGPNSNILVLEPCERFRIGISWLKLTLFLNSSGC